MIEYKCPIDNMKCELKNPSLMWHDSEIVCPEHGLVGFHDSEFGGNDYLSKETILAYYKRKKA